MHTCTRLQVPNGLLPVIELDGRVVTESAVIMNLLEQAFPDNKPLMPPQGGVGYNPGAVQHWQGGAGMGGSIVVDGI